MKKNRSKLHTFVITIILSLITLVGIVLRLANLSPFKFYPDSYQNLIVAENIRTYHNVVGFLGPQGMLYPDFFTWTHPLYPLLINLGSLFIPDTTFVARLISFLAGVITIPLTFFFIKSVFRSITYALAGAFLLAFSFNHTIWSGFIMTETVGILFMLFFLWFLFLSISSKTRFASPSNILTGILFCGAVLTRYEYIIMLFPVIFLVIKLSPHPFRYLTNLIATFFLGLVTIGIILYPWQSTLYVIIEQSQNLLQRIGLIVILFLLIYSLMYILSQKFKHKLFQALPQFITGLLCIFALYICLQMLGIVGLPFLWNDLSFVRNFVQHDFLISIFALIGFILLLLQNAQLRVFGYFSLLCILFLGVLYHRTNPDMERYLTHLLPFLLIPASYAFGKIVQYLLSFKLGRKYVSFLKITKQSILILALSIILLLQAKSTFFGLRYLNDSSWYHLSYEEQAALEVKKYIAKSCTSNQSCEPLILAAFPEPYFYILHHTTYSITDTYPYIYIPDSLNKKHIVIIEDMGMRDIFPSLASFLEENLQAYRMDELKINENYHYANRSEKATQPLNIYDITLGELKEKIK